MPVDKTDCWVEDDVNGSWWWPYCAVEGCENRICLGISDRFCFLHSPGNQHVNRMKIAAKNATPLSEIEPEPAPKTETV